MAWFTLGGACKIISEEGNKFPLKRSPNNGTQCFQEEEILPAGGGKVFATLIFAGGGARKNTPKALRRSNPHARAEAERREPLAKATEAPQGDPE